MRKSNTATANFDVDDDVNMDSDVDNIVDVNIVIIV